MWSCFHTKRNQKTFKAQHFPHSYNSTVQSTPHSSPIHTFNSVHPFTRSIKPIHIHIDIYIYIYQPKHIDNFIHIVMNLRLRATQFLPRVVNHTWDIHVTLVKKCSKLQIILYYIVPPFSTFSYHHKKVWKHNLNLTKM